MTFILCLFYVRSWFYRNVKNYIYIFTYDIMHAIQPTVFFVLLLTSFKIKKLKASNYLLRSLL